MPYRLLDPVQALVVEHAPAQDRLVHAEPLVEVRHHGDALAHSLLHRPHRGQVLGRIVAADAQLHRGEVAFGGELLGFVGQLLHRLNPQAAAVVGAHRPRLAAEQLHQRHALGLRERIPGGHVDPRQRDADQARGVEQLHLPAQLGVQLEGRAERRP